jgi:hypothetical protein
MQRLKMVAVEEVGLEILIFRVVFQTFLRIFLVKVLVAVEDQENQIIEDLT